jgi:hypothetical protein
MNNVGNKGVLTHAEAYVSLIPNDGSIDIIYPIEEKSSEILRIIMLTN